MVPRTPSSPPPPPPSPPQVLSRALIFVLLLMQAILAAGVASREDINRLLGQQASIVNWNEFFAANNMRGWDISISVCTWTGVNCSSAGDIVVLDLGCDGQEFELCGGVTLSGTLTSDLGGIKSLQYLYLSGTNFSGGLPEVWGSPGMFSSLKALGLWGARLNGTLPASWGASGAFPELRWLYFGDNALSGTIPESWGQQGAFPMMEKAWLNFNNLTGMLPQWAAQAFASLTVLHLANNNISGPLPPAWSGSGYWPRLVALQLSNNRLSGSLPPSWGTFKRFPALQILALDGNQLEGSIPPSWAQQGALPSLEVLNLGQNPDICGPVPDSLSPAVCELGASQCSDNNGTQLGDCPETWLNDPNEGPLDLGEGVPVPVEVILAERCAEFFQQRDANFTTCRTALDKAMLADAPSCPEQCKNLFKGLEQHCMRAVKLSLIQTIFRNPEDQTNDEPFDICRTLCSDYSTVGCEISYTAVKALQPLWQLHDPDNLAWLLIAVNSTSPKEPADGSPNTPVGAIAGGAVGGVVVLAVLAFLALRPGKGWLCRTPRPTDAAPVYNSPKQMLFSTESGSLPDHSAGDPPLAPAPALPEPALLSVQTLTGESDSLPLSYITTGGPATCPATTSVSLGSLEDDPLLTHIATCLGTMRRGSGTFTAGQSARHRSLPADVAQWVMPWHQIVLRRPIGRGSFGRVYLASWNATPVAVKVLLGADGDEQLGRLELPEPVMSQLLEECQVMSRIRHPNVVSFMGLCTLPPCILTEFCSHGSLYDVLRQALADPQFAAQLTWQCRLQMAYDGARGLLYLHSRGILHRDVKSPNMLVDEHMAIKICDFNLSSLLRKARQQPDDSDTPTNPRWLPPELLRAEHAVAASDCYSFALVLWELLTWRMPWRGLTPFQIRRCVLDGKRPELPSHEALPGPDRPSPEALEAYCRLVRDCWRQEPEERPALEDVVARLGELVGPQE